MRDHGLTARKEARRPDVTCVFPSRESFWCSGEDLVRPRAANW